MKLAALILLLICGELAGFGIGFDAGERYAHKHCNEYRDKEK